MRYFFFYLLLCAHYVCGQQNDVPKQRIRVTAHSRYSKTLTMPQLSEIEINTIQSQFQEIAKAISIDLLKYAQPTQIQVHLDNWDNLKTAQYNMPIDDIKRILITAQKALELAKEVALKQDSNLQSSSKVQFTNATSDNALMRYIDAQLNYNKICDHLGIVPKSS